MLYQWDIIGHQPKVQYLQNSIKNGKINQAYLFYGPAHLGKKKIAESFLFSLFCVSQTNARPCGRCQNCAQIRKNIHPDVYWLEPEEGKKNISIKQVRDLIIKLQKKSLHQGYKVALIKQASSLTLSAANALLKTLEEPAPKTVLILLAEDISRLPETIVSRCQTLPFLPVSQKDIYAYCTTQTNRDQAQEITRLCQGLPGLAINWLEKKNGLSQYQKKIKNIEVLLDSNLKEKFKLAEKIQRSKKSALELSELLDLALFSLRTKLLDKKTIGRVKKIEQAQNLLRQNVQPKLILENLIISL